MPRLSALLGVLALALVTCTLVRRASENRAARSAAQGSPGAAGAAQERLANAPESPAPAGREAVAGPGRASLVVQVVALEGGAPLEQVSLELFPLDEDRPHEWRQSPAEVPAHGLDGDTLRTGADGRAEFVVEAGFAYGLRARAPDDSAAPAQLELGRLVADERRTVSLALPTRWAHEWTGRVLDGASGNALAGAEVEALRPRTEWNPDIAVRAQGWSDAQGLVRLRLPEWGELMLRVHAPGHASEAFLLDSGTSSEAPQPLELQAEAALLVIARDAEGAACAGATLRILRHPSAHTPPLEERAGLDSVWSLALDDAGRGEVSGLPSGVVLGTQFLRDERHVEWPQRTGDRLELAPGERRELAWVVPRGERVVGRVLDASGRALAGVALELLECLAADCADGNLGRFHVPRDGFLGPVLMDETTTDARGAFQFDDVLPGRWQLSPGGGDLPNVRMPFEVRPGVASALELRLARDLWISGSVGLPEGAPARPVWVRGLGLGDLAGIELAVESDADGAFRLGPLVPGEYRVLPSPEESLLCAPLEITAAAGSAGLELVLRRFGAPR